MKNVSYLFIVFLLLQFNSLSQSGWIQQTSGTIVELNSVFFINENVGWIVGDGGTIKHTTDGGENWNSQYNTNDDYETVQFVDADNGWIVGEGSLFRTTDGGLNWIDISDSIITHCAYFVDENNGWRGGRFGGGGCIYKTTDGGVTWSEQWCEGVLPIDFHKIQFISSNIGWAIASCPLIALTPPQLYMTTNGGEDWNHLSSVSGSICFIDSLNGWLTDSYFPGTTGAIEIKNTTDGGYSWHQQFFHSFYQSWSMSLPTIFFVDIDKGWTAGDSLGLGFILHTSNSGVDWMSQDCGIVPPINSIYFTDENNGWAVGDSGLVLHTTTGGVVSVEEEQIEGVPTEYSLKQNFPNPFNPSTTIKFSVPQSSNVVIKVFDILGNEIETLVNEEKSVGTYEITWTAENLPSGVYFYRLQTDAFVKTEKMLLVK